MDFYKAISAWYDDIFPPDETQKNFVLSHMLLPSPCAAQSVSTVLLDIGCATGSLLLSLAPHFSRAVGLDLDLSLLNQAKAKTAHSDAGKNITFIEENMMNIDAAVPGSNIAAALCMGNTIPHLTSANDLQLFFTQVREKLSPGGLFIFQIINYDRILQQHLHSLPLLNNETIKFERSYSDSNPDGTITFSAALTVHAQNKTVRNSVTLRPYTRSELETALHKAGFAERAWYGSFADAPWTPESFLTIGVCTA